MTTKTYQCSADIYAELVENVPDNEDWLLGLVAFAVVEEQRIEWMRHFEDCNGKPPSNEEVSDWYKQQPSGVLLRARDTARARLTNYAQAAIEAFAEDFKDETVKGIVVQEIREIKSFWPQFGVNLAGGFVSSILFATLLTLVAIFVLNDSSPVDIAKHVNQSAEGTKHGKEN